VNNMGYYKRNVKVKQTHKTGKKGIQWSEGIKPCLCNRKPCPRPGGQACKRRGLRQARKEGDSDECS